MRLYLVQHGHAQPKDVDPDRPLTPAGAADIDRLAARLAGLGVRVERVLHSGKTRALQTAAALARQLLEEGEMDTTGLLEPEAPAAPMAEILEGSDEPTLVVGHLPMLGRLAARLIGAREEAPALAFRPGTAACLERDPQGDWRLLWLLPPELY